MRVSYGLLRRATMLSDRITKADKLRSELHSRAIEFWESIIERNVLEAFENGNYSCEIRFDDDFNKMAKTSKIDPFDINGKVIFPAEISKQLYELNYFVSISDDSLHISWREK